MGVTCFLEIQIIEHCKPKWKHLPIEIGERWGVLLQNADSILKVEGCQDIQLSNNMGFRMGVTYLEEIQHNRALWIKVSISENWKRWKVGSNPMKFRLNSQSGTLCMTFYLLTKLVFKWELLVFLKYSIRKHYLPN
jgi:hypothetical protein